MTQLRQDPTTKEWVIIAAERSRRPHDFVKTESLVEKPPYKEDCPFCPGNEHLTLMSPWPIETVVSQTIWDGGKGHSKQICCPLP